ncbi:hypothetical protein AVEN_255028-1 [Araneus ventricosus]|uniref:Uncharacterized protein n=1 Tax=Araneus ventricosus TaxID=182803 RepID=A0A4Y2LVH3_ARAVE|nr:hypothetical protein AVEN_255028-1 [Araneus ventricosus]
MDSATNLVLIRISTFFINIKFHCVLKTEQNPENSYVLFGQVNVNAQHTFRRVDPCYPRSHVQRFGAPCTKDFSSSVVGRQRIGCTQAFVGWIERS